MGAQAELLILPEMSVADLKQAMARLEKATKDAARKAGDEFEDEIERGFAAGMKRGIKKFGGGIKNNAGAIGGGLFGVLMAGLGKSIADFEAGQGIVENRLSQGTNAQMIRSSDLLGIDAGTMGKLWGQARAAGFTDFADFSDILSNVMLKISEAEAGEDPLLNQFKGKRGIEALGDVLASLANADPADRIRWMDKLEAGERLPEMTALLEAIRHQSGGKVSADWIRLAGSDVDRGLAIESGAAKERQFSRMAIEAEERRAEREMEAITGSTLKTWADEQRRITNENVRLIKSLEANAAAAIPARELMADALELMSDHLLKLIKFGQRTAEGVEGAQKALEAQNSGHVAGAVTPGMHLGGGMVPTKRGG